MIEAVGWLAVLLTAAQLIPQVVRTTRTGDTAGVSAGMFAIMLAQAWAWIGYAARQELLQPIIVNLVLTTCAVMMIRLLWRNGAPHVATAIAAVIGLLVVELLVFLWAPPDVLGVLATALAFLLLWPQVFVAMRSRDLSGLSASSWVLSVSNTVLWVIYGVGRGAELLWLSAGHALALSIVILARMAFVQRRQAAGTGLVASSPTV
jgi:uncharacterized protein with PQ loop repeat